MIFYTIIYKIQSKFNFDKYIEWGKNLIEYVKHYKLVIFTNDETHELIKNIIKDKNIFIIKLNIEDFYFYRYRNFLIKNTNKDCFPDHSVSYQLILLWIERHLLVEKLVNKHKSDFYCYIDWGYVREKIVCIENNNNNNNKDFKINNNFVYWGLVNPKKNAFDFYKNVFNKNNKDLNKNVKEIIVNQKIEKYQPIFGGGFSIIPANNVSWFVTNYKKSLLYFLNNQILFKDDQTIIAFMIMNHLDKFKLVIKEKDKIEWFPFLYYFINKYEIY
jgi:hypothetical protein